MAELSDRERALVEELWDSIPPQASDILGAEVTLGKIKLSEGVEELGKRTYFSTLTTERPHRVDIFLGVDDRSAIAFAGLLVMMQEKVINEKMSRREMDEDDLDAMSECVNQLGSAINKSLHTHLGNEYHVVVTGGGIEDPEAIQRYRGQRVIVARGKLTIGTLHTGEFRILLPEMLFTGVAPEDADRSALSLSPEEAEALRQATIEGLDGNERVYLYLPLDRDEDEWRTHFGTASIDVEVVSDLHQIRRACRTGDAQLVLIDADACAQGGLPALAQLLSWPDVNVPVVVAASRPTRTHLVSCLAAGSATYFVKPLDDTLFRERIAQLLEVWNERQAQAATS